VRYGDSRTSDGIAQSRNIAELLAGILRLLPLRTARKPSQLPDAGYGVSKFERDQRFFPSRCEFRPIIIVDMPISAYWPLRKVASVGGFHLAWNSPGSPRCLSGPICALIASGQEICSFWGARSHIAGHRTGAGSTASCASRLRTPPPNRVAKSLGRNPETTAATNAPITGSGGRRQSMFRRIALSHIAASDKIADICGSGPGRARPSLCGVSLRGKTRGFQHGRWISNKSGCRGRRPCATPPGGRFDCAKSRPSTPHIHYLRLNREHTDKLRNWTTGTMPESRLRTRDNGEKGSITVGKENNFTKARRIASIPRCRSAVDALLRSRVGHAGDEYRTLKE